MASGFNKVIALGNLGRDPELKDVGSSQVCEFSIAVNESYKDRDGNRKESVEWIKVVAWGKLAELCGKYLSKGRQAFIEGKLRTRTYEKDGEKRYATEIVAADVQFLSSGQQTSQPQGGGGPPPAPNFEPSQDGPDDDIPFAANAVEFGIGDDPTPTAGRRAV